MVGLARVNGLKHWAVLAAILIVLVLLAVSRTKLSENAIDVSVEEVEIGSLSSSVIASGTLVFRDEVELRSEVIGKVIDLRVSEGDTVTEGQLLLSLDPELYQADIEQQEANVGLQELAIATQKKIIENTLSQWHRQRALRADGLIGEQEFETIQHSLELARIDLQSREHSLDQATALLDKAQDFLDKTRIRSPLDGIVIALDVEVGETVITGTTNIAGSSLMTIAAPEDILAEVYVDEADIASLELGQSADIYAVAYPNKPIRGEVEAIGSTARQYPGRNGLSFKVGVRLEAADEIHLYSGMSCRAEIFSEGLSDSVVVPIESVLFEEGDSQIDVRAYLYVEEEGRAIRREVILGASSDDSQAIESGLEAGETLITGPYRALDQLEDGAAVTTNES